MMKNTTQKNNLFSFIPEINYRELIVADLLFCSNFYVSIAKRNRLDELGEEPHRQLVTFTTCISSQSALLKIVSLIIGIKLQLSILTRVSFAIIMNCQKCLQQFCKWHFYRRLYDTRSMNYAM